MYSQDWLNQHIEKLVKNSPQNILFEQSNHVYCFANERKIKTTHSTTIHATTGKEPINIKTDMRHCGKPLSFAEYSMRRAQITISFQNISFNSFGTNIPLLTTSSNHYTIPLTQANQLANNLEKSISIIITLTVTETKCNHDMAQKMHPQYVTHT